MDTALPPDASPDPASVHAQSALQERRYHALKSGDTFAMLDRLGDAVAAPGSSDGLYHRDTRYLSGFNLLLGGARPLLLSSAVGADNLTLTANLTNPLLRSGEGEVEQGLIYLRRTVFLSNGSCFTRISVANQGMTACTIPLELRFAADFADLFEVRGMQRPRRGMRSAEVLPPDSAQVTYRGLDGQTRCTSLRFDPVPDWLEAGGAGFALPLAPRQRAVVWAEVRCGEANPAAPRPGKAYASALLQARQAMRSSAARTALTTADNPAFADAMERAAYDLRMLTTQKPTGPYPYAGIPWFSTAFGRDALITALLVLWQDPSLARGVLRYLAQEQATAFDPASDAEPGKILHEVRAGEMAEMREVPFRRYYGSVDATPLFVMLAGAYLERTGDGDSLRALWPNIRAALDWIAGKANADGFVAYNRMTEDGLANQGWKDSYDSISHADGTLAVGPIALCEVQGYVYAAYRAAAGIARRIGEPGSQALDAAAEDLRQAFEARFWCERLGTYVIALDGAGRPCEVRSSNAGHALLAGIASPERAARVAEQLIGPALFTGWGVRTLAVDEVRYNPMSYHNGSVWPHDNALIALGLARYGLIGAASRLFEGLFAACATMELRRLPELFCGFSRRLGQQPTAYPVACAPQAWAAASLPALLQACLGLSFRPDEQTVRLDRPVLPPFLGHVTLHNLSLGAALLTLSVSRQGTTVALAILSASGQVQVTHTAEEPRANETG